MSTQKGNSKRTRAQKHQNNFAFKNDLHDKTVKNKMINKIEVGGVCARCKDVIEWRIRYKKYKPLTVPKKCIKCEGKTVLFAYHVMCLPCAQKLGVCGKCGQSEKEIIAAAPTPKDIQKQKCDLEMEIKSLSERQRRSLLRSTTKSGGGNSSKNLSATATDEICDDKFDQLSLNSSFSSDDDF